MQRLCPLARGKHRFFGSWRGQFGEGFYSFLFGLPCSPLAAAHPMLAAAKGEQDEKHITISPSPRSLRLCGEISLRLARKQHSAAGNSPPTANHSI